VAIIKSYAATLAREDVVWSPETIQRVSHNIEDECDRLHRLITDLLDLSRIQAGRVAMRVGSVDLPHITAEIVDQLSPRAPRHSLRMSFPPNFPIIRGDADQLRRALFNLVQNAIKYSPEGGEVLIAGELAPPMGVLLRVIDHGIGLAANDRERIFERFHRADNRLSRTTAGFGLGLYITRSIVEGHGGRIWADSPGPGGGSVFTILLPIGAEQRAPRPV
jgi:signal transduction histidine kinase